MQSLVFLSLLIGRQPTVPRDRFDWVDEGSRLYQAQQYAQAADAYRQAVRNGDRTPNTEYQLACSLALAGKPDASFAALQTAIREGFRAGDTLEGDPDLRTLHSDKRWAAAIEACKKNAADRLARMSDPDKARIDVDDLKRFWKAYRESRNQPKPDTVCAESYLRDADTPVTYMLARARIKPRDFPKLLSIYRDYFAFLDIHQADFTAQAAALRDVFHTFKRLYPEAVFPDIHVVIGGMSSGGTTSDDGLLIGAELFGRYPDTPTHELDDWAKRVILPPTDFVTLVVHECAHYQQFRPPVRTLLFETLHEGAADFTSYLVTGRLIERMRETHMWANAREREIWTEFQKEMDGTDTKGWLAGNPKPGWPDDIAYWLGFKICECYYGRAADKKQALKDILTMKDPKAFLEASGYPAWGLGTLASCRRHAATPVVGDAERRTLNAER